MIEKSTKSKKRFLPELFLVALVVSAAILLFLKPVTIMPLTTFPDLSLDSTTLFSRYNIEEFCGIRFIPNQPKRGDQVELFCYAVGSFGNEKDTIGMPFHLTPAGRTVEGRDFSAYKKLFPEMALTRGDIIDIFGLSIKNPLPQSFKYLSLKYDSVTRLYGIYIDGATKTGVTLNPSPPRLYH